MGKISTSLYWDSFTLAVRWNVMMVFYSYDSPIGNTNIWLHVKIDQEDTSEMRSAEGGNWVEAYKSPIKVKVSQSCLTLCHPMDCSLPGSSVHGILQARILEWVAFPISRGSSRPKDRTQVFCVTGRFFTMRATKEADVIPNNKKSHWEKDPMSLFAESWKGGTCTGKEKLNIAFLINQRGRLKSVSVSHVKGGKGRWRMVAWLCRHHLGVMWWKQVMLQTF